MRPRRHPVTRDVTRSPARLHRSTTMRRAPATAIRFGSSRARSATSLTLRSLWLLRTRSTVSASAGKRIVPQTRARYENAGTSTANADATDAAGWSSETRLDAWRRQDPELSVSEIADRARQYREGPCRRHG